MTAMYHGLSTHRAIGLPRIVTRMWHTREIFAKRTQTCVGAMRFCCHSELILGPRA